MNEDLVPLFTDGKNTYIKKAKDLTRNPHSWITLLAECHDTHNIHSLFIFEGPKYWEISQGNKKKLKWRFQKYTN